MSGHRFNRIIPRGPGTARVDVYSRTMTTSSKKRIGVAETLVKGNVRCLITSASAIGIDTVFGPTSERVLVAVMPKNPTIEEKYVLVKSSDSTVRWTVASVERLPNDDDVQVQVASLSRDTREGRA